MDSIRSNVINLRTNSSPYYLNEYISDHFSYPLMLFGEDKPTALVKAVELLKSQKYGEVEVPPTSIQDIPTKIVAGVDKFGNLMLNIISHGYRYPINNESRPFSVDGKSEWQIGDQIINNEPASRNKCQGWICIEAGTPGEWVSYGFARKWSSELEKVNELPEPSVLQEGRMLLCKDENNKWYPYYCSYSSTDENNVDIYVWNKLGSGGSGGSGGGDTIATIIEGTDGNWRLTNIGDIQFNINDPHATIVSKITSILSVLFIAPSDSINNHKISVGQDEIELTYFDGYKVNAKDIKEGQLISANLDLSTGLFIINSESKDNSVTLEVDTDGNWVITKIGYVSISSDLTLAELKELFPNIVELKIRVPESSVNDQAVIIGSVTINLTYMNGDNVNAKDIAKNTAFACYMDLTNGVVSVPGVSYARIALGEDKVTTFNADGSITETTNSGSTVTEFRSDGSITETYTRTGSTESSVKVTTFNEDGSIKEEIQ